MGAATISGLFVIPSPNNGAVGGGRDQFENSPSTAWHLKPLSPGSKNKHLKGKSFSHITTGIEGFVAEFFCLRSCGNEKYPPLPFEENPQLCSPKNSPKRTRNGNFAPTRVKNEPKQATMHNAPDVN